MATEPITLGEAKSWLRVTINDDDAVIGSLVTAAREHIENAMRRKLVSTTVTEYLDDFADPIKLRWSSLVSVTSIKYYDTAGVQQTLAAATYTVDTTQDPGQIHLAPSYSWPAIQDIPDAIEIIYVAGYGTSETDTPAVLKTAIKLLLAHWYEHREAATDGRPVVEIPMSVKSIIWQYKVPEAHS